jgi:type II secretory pathway pseudopilin PulG
MYPLRSRSARGTAGSSLVELLIAASMLAISMMAALRSQISSVQLMKEARETEVAVQVLHEAMAQALLATNDDLATGGGDYAPDVALDTSLTLKDQDVRYTLPGYGGGAVPACLTIRFQLSWTSRSGIARTMTLVGTKR